MKKQHTGLEIFLPALNVGPEQTREFRYRLRMRHLGEVDTSHPIRKLTSPSREPRSYLALPGEVRGLQRRAGIRRPTEADAQELKEYVDETLPESWRKWTIDAPSLPLRFEDRHRRGHREEMLSIAGCERTPKGIWMDDVTATRPVIARAYENDSIDLLYELGSEIELSEDNALLPPTTQLGGVVTRLVAPESES